MNITLRYEPTPETLACASLIFLEHKPIVKFSMVLFNIIAILFGILLFIKFFLTARLTPQEGLLLAFCLFWLLMRKPLTQKLLIARMKRAPIYNKTLEIILSNNGIVWKGQGLLPGSLGWPQIKRIYRLNNGYIIPCTPAKFLWLPAKEFTKSSQEEFESFCQNAHIQLKTVKKQC